MTPQAQPLRAAWPMGGLRPGREGLVTWGGAPPRWEVGWAELDSSGPALAGLGSQAPVRTPHRGPRGAQSAARRWGGRRWAGRAQG